MKKKKYCAVLYVYARECSDTPNEKTVVGVYGPYKTPEKAEKVGLLAVEDMEDRLGYVFDFDYSIFHMNKKYSKFPLTSF